MFWPLQSNSEVSGISKDSQVPILGVWVSPSHSSKSGVVIIIPFFFAYLCVWTFDYGSCAREGFVSNNYRCRKAKHYWHTLFWHMSRWWCYYWQVCPFTYWKWRQHLIGLWEWSNRVATIIRSCSCVCCALGSYRIRTTICFNYYMVCCALGPPIMELKWPMLRLSKVSINVFVVESYSGLQLVHPIGYKQNSLPN